MFRASRSSFSKGFCSIQPELDRFKLFVLVKHNKNDLKIEATDDSSIKNEGI